MCKKLFVLLLLVAFTASMASAEIVRVNYDYATTGIGTGQGLWSVTIDSGLIPGEDAGDDVTFIAPMATPAFVQRDSLLGGEVNPGTSGLAGWANDARDDGLEKGMEWKFYSSTDIVTLVAVTEGYSDYSWDIQTVLSCPDKNQDEICNDYYWRVSLSDNPDGGLDVTIAQDKRHRTVSYWGDVDTGDGHRHSGNKWDWDDDPTFLVGQDALTEAHDGALDEMADGDGIGVALGLREWNKDDVLGDASIFFSDVRFGGDVFANTNTIPEPATIALLGLGGLALLRRRRS